MHQLCSRSRLTGPLSQLGPITEKSTSPRRLRGGGSVWQGRTPAITMQNLHHHLKDLAKIKGWNQVSPGHGLSPGSDSQAMVVPKESLPGMFPSSKTQRIHTSPAAKRTRSAAVLGVGLLSCSCASSDAASSVPRRRSSRVTSAIGTSHTSLTCKQASHSCNQVILNSGGAPFLPCLTSGTCPSAGR